MRGPGANLKTQYAVQAVLYLARQEPLRVVPIVEIAGAVGISTKFLEDIFGALRVAGIVKSRRGKEGGYRLVPAPSALSTLELVEAVEGPIAARAQGNGTLAARVAARAFDDAMAAAAAVLAATTVEQLLGDMARLEAEHGRAYMYHL